MKYFRLVGLIIFISGLTLTASIDNVSAAGRELPPLSTPAMYLGEYNQEGYSYKIALYLFGTDKDNRIQTFLINEETTPINGKTSSWSTSGNWYQIRSGSFLQLTNSHNFYRLMNVGGAGYLYTTVQLPSGKQIMLTLKEKAQNLQEDKVFPNAYSQEETEVLNYNFLRDIAGKQWKIIRLDGKKPDRDYYLNFGVPQQNKDNGNIDIFDGNIHMTVLYTLKNKIFSISTTTDITDQKISGLIAGTHSLRLTGEVLELWGEKEILALLENVR